MRILLVEDSPTDRQLLRYLLESRFQAEAKFREADNLDVAISILERGDIDCVVLDLQLPDSTGKETFLRLTERFPHVPIIVMTHNKDRNLALEMIQAGAADYILKNYTDEEDIFRRVVFAIEKHRRTIRMRPDSASSVHKLERARANMLSAQQLGIPEAVQNSTVEATSAVADVSRKMFTEIQSLSDKITRQGTQQDHLLKTVDALNEELLVGKAGRRSMRSEMDLIQHRVGEVEKRLSDVDTVDVISHRLESAEKKLVEVSEASTKAVDSQRITALEIQKTSMTLRSKIIIAVLGLLGVIATAIVTYATAGAKKDASTQTPSK